MDRYRKGMGSIDFINVDYMRKLLLSILNEMEKQLDDALVSLQKYNPHLCEISCEEFEKLVCKVAERKCRISPKDIGRNWADMLADKITAMSIECTSDKIDYRSCSMIRFYEDIERSANNGR